jgi:hypothetical protein
MGNDQLWTSEAGIFLTFGDCSPEIDAAANGGKGSISDPSNFEKAG